MKRPLFLAYVRQCLIPPSSAAKLYSRTICRYTRSSASPKRSKKRVRRRSICPKYSPDLNPIGLAFSKIKAHLHKVAERTIENAIERSPLFLNERTPLAAVGKRSIENAPFQLRLIPRTQCCRL